MAMNRLLSTLLLLGWMLLPQSNSLMAADSRLQVLNFSMERCEPCKAMQPVLAKLIMDGWQIRQIDIAAEPQLVDRFKLQSAPTLVMLLDGREVDRVVGTIAYSKLLARLEAASRGTAVDQAASNTPKPNFNTQAAATSAATPASAPQLLSERAAPASAPKGSLERPAFDQAMVRGQSPGPADVPDLNIDNERMLDFVKDLPDPPKSPTAVSSPAPSRAAPTNIQLASASAPRIAQPQVFTQVESNVDPIARAQQATVRIRIEDANSIAFGTGTVIYIHQGQALVLTCGHMFRDLSAGAQMSVDVFDSNGRITNVPANVVSHSTDKGDIGLMEFRCPFPITPVPISKRAPELGDAAFSFGCDRGADPTRRDTQIKRINRYLGPANIEIHGAPVVGRSGGALFNARGQIIGVCNAADAEDDEGIYAGLPVIDDHVAALNLDDLPQDGYHISPVPGFAPGTAAGQVAAAAGPAAPAMSTISSAAPPTQVRAVIRDAQGKETAVLIERPSEELVALLKQASKR